MTFNVGSNYHFRHVITIHTVDSDLIQQGYYDDNVGDVKQNLFQRFLQRYQIYVLLWLIITYNCHVKANDAYAEGASQVLCKANVVEQPFDFFSQPETNICQALQ